MTPDLNGAPAVLYTVCNFGVPIGTTDLGFHVVLPEHRMGEFHPNAEGERLMPIVTETYAAIHADLEALRPTPSERTRAALAAAEEKLGLTLHLPDGTRLPVSMIGIRDMEQVVSLNVPDDADAEELLGGLSPEEREELEREVAEMMEAWEEERALQPWEPEPEARGVARYQLHVTVDAGAFVP